MSKKLVEFGPDQAAALERLAERFGQTQSGIVRASVALFQIATREAERGNALGIIHGDRVLKEVAGAWSAAEPVTA